ncbi:unnamed protein product [Blepharisma stoltei]|uniref:Uncharacterized protein n=1 Tax=Blepharisma stoltei TaxID=1481888 RepID=A0AAU9JUB3_9CILI|nr:unnamed protein product [Blepharisma stoltei]
MGHYTNLPILKPNRLLNMPIFAQNKHKKSISLNHSLISSDKSKALDINKSYTLITKDQIIDCMKSSQSFKTMFVKDNNKDKHKTIEKTMNALAAIQRKVYRIHSLKQTSNCSFNSVIPAPKTYGKKKLKRCTSYAPRIKIWSKTSEKPNDVFKSSLSAWMIEETKRDLLTPSPRINIK